MLFINDSNLYSLQYLLYKLINDAQALRQIAAESGEVINTVPIESMKMALTVIVTGPILLLYPFVQRYFIKGLTLGAVKGVPVRAAKYYESIFIILQPDHIHDSFKEVSYEKDTQTNSPRNGCYDSTERISSNG